MFMFISLLAASVDGFICGLMIGGVGVKFRFTDFVKSFGIIFLCCCAAAVTGNLLAYTQLQLYINIVGVAVMLLLGISCLSANTEVANKEVQRTDIMAFSVAMDASVVCLYLAMCGYNIIFIAFVSASLHSVLMYIAAFISNKVIKERWIFCTRYISGIGFLCMALIKLINLE